MRKVKLSKQQFDNLFFPNTMNVAADDETEFEVGIRLVRALRDPNKTQPKDLTPEQRQFQDQGIRQYPSHELRRENDHFILEEDVHRLAIKRLKVNMKRIPPLSSEDYQEMFDLVKDAEEWEPPKKDAKKAAKKKAADK